MSGTVSINGKTLTAIRDAAKAVSYSRDYVTRLAREEKVVATQVGRQWFVDIDSLKRYVEDSQQEQEIRKQKLSEERKRERQVQEAAVRQQARRAKQANTMHGRAVAVSVLALTLGLTSGWSLLESGVFTSNQSDFGSAQVNRALQLSERSAPHFESAVASREVAPMENVGSGILLFPTQGQASATQLFSDEVRVRQVDADTYEVVRVDAAGAALGTPVPFVEVPIERTRQ